MNKKIMILVITIVLFHFQIVYTENITFDWKIGDEWKVNNSNEITSLSDPSYSKKIYDEINFKIVSIEKISNIECYKLLVNYDGDIIYLYYNKNNFNLIKITELNQKLEPFVSYLSNNEIIFDIPYYLRNPILYGERTIIDKEKKKSDYVIKQQIIPYKNGSKIVIYKKQPTIRNASKKEDYKTVEITHYWEPGKKWWLKSEKRLTDLVYRYDKIKKCEGFSFLDMELINDSYLVEENKKENN
jgi:hypothetical protein